MSTSKDGKTPVLDYLANSVMRVRQTTSAIGNSVSDKSAAVLLAEVQGGEAKDRTVRVRRFPEGYDAEYKAVMSALNKPKKEFLATTMPLGMGAGENDDGTRSASGDRAIHIPKLMEGWEAKLRGYAAELDVKRQELADALPRIKDAIMADPRARASWVESEFPTREKVLKSFRWELVGPHAIVSGAQLENMPVKGVWLDEYRDQKEAEAREQAQFGQQRMAQELLKFVANLAEQTSKLVAHKDTPKDERVGKAPKITETLTTNVSRAIEQIKTYAIPGTPEGDKLLALAERALEELEVDRIEAEDLKDNVPLARSTSERAAALAEAIENWHLEAAVGQHTPEPPVPEDAAPVWVPPVPEEEEDAAPVF